MNKTSDERTRYRRLAELGQQLSVPVVRTSLWRWHRKGVRGVRLHAKKVGDHWYSTIAAVEAFQDELNRTSENVKGENV